MMWSELYPITKEDEEEILKINGVTKEQIEKNVAILEDWYGKQQHFPDKYPYGHFLPRMLSVNEFNVETTKKKIEAYFTLKNVYHDFYNAFNVDKIVMPTENFCAFVPMPKLGPKKQRIYVGEFRSSDITKFNQKHYEQLNIHDIEFGIQFDKITKAVCVVDCRNTSLEMLTKIDLSGVMRMTNLVLNAYEPDVIEAIHLLNLNKAASIIFNFLKKFVHHKIMETVHVHNDLESLYKFVPKEYLPEEHGGTQGSMSKIIPLMDQVLLENKEYLLDLPKFAVDESLRLGDNHYSNMFGSEGTFRKLNID